LAIFVMYHTWGDPPSGLAINQDLFGTSPARFWVEPSEQRVARLKKHKSDCSLLA
jgi:hypothetical protein